MTRATFATRTPDAVPSWSLPETMSSDPCDLRLTASHIAELDRARYAVRRAGLPMMSVRREDFPLPTLGPVLAGIARDLDRSPGFFVIRGLPTEYAERDLRLVYWGLGRHLGIAVPQDTTGRVLLPADNTSAAFHSGGSDVVSLLSVDGGHEVDLVSAGALFNEVATRRPLLAARMFDAIAFENCGQEADEQPYRMLPLACWSDGRLSLRYDRASIERAQSHRGTPELSVADRELLDLVDELLPKLQHEVRLAAGDLLLVNNHEVVHRLRGEVPAGRGLLRLWLTLRNGRDLPRSYVWPTQAYGEEVGRCGVTPRDVIDRSAPARHPAAPC